MKRINGLLKALIRIMRASIAANDEFVAMATALNTKRQLYISAVAVPFSLACLIVFNGPVARQSQIWHRGIISSHVALVLFMSLAGILSRRLARRGQGGQLPRLIQYISMIFVLLIGLIITIFDQLVVSGITPFLIACVFAGFAFLIRPLFSVTMYLSLAFIMMECLRLTQSDPVVLLSNQLNGIAASGLGLILSIITWKSFVRQARQENYIQKQQIELENKNIMLDQLASYDSLTGLKNRRAFQETVRQEFARLQRNQSFASLIIMDIDHFKNINDKFGHPAGDKILIQIAGILSGYLRDSDTIARWGGEEFAFLLPETELSVCREIAERLRQVIANQEFKIDGSTDSIRLTASFGAAELSAADAACEAKACFEKAYRNADRALYKAKLNGRNRVEVHTAKEKYYQQIPIVG
jgi:diguanylate cyclase (GGDEF)-like protein